MFSLIFGSRTWAFCIFSTAVTKNFNFSPLKVIIIHLNLVVLVSVSIVKFNFKFKFDFVTVSPGLRADFSNLALFFVLPRPPHPLFYDPHDIQSPR